MATEKKSDEKKEEAFVLNESSKQLIKAANSAGIAEAAAIKLGQQLEKDGYHVAKTDIKPQTELRVQPAKS